MKRSIVFLLCILLLAACRQQDSEETLIPVLSTDESKEHMPHSLLVFTSKDKVDQFLSYAGQNAELSLYLKEPWVVNEPEDAVYYAGIIRSIPWPSAGVSIDSLYLDEDTQWAVFGCLSANGITTYVGVSFAEEDPSNQLESAKERNRFQLIPQSVSWAETAYYCDSPAVNNTQYYYILLDGYFVSISMVTEDLSAAEAILQQLSFQKYGQDIQLFHTKY